MRKLWLSLLFLSFTASIPAQVAADGVNAGLVDRPVVPVVRGASTAATQNNSHVLPGSNQVGRPGLSADQVGGYDVNVAYDHVAVSVAIVAVLFLMTEWMEAR